MPARCPAHPSSPASSAIGWPCQAKRRPAPQTSRSRRGPARAGDTPLSPAGALPVTRDSVSLESHVGGGPGAPPQHHPIRLWHGRVGFLLPSFLPNRIVGMFIRRRLLRGGTERTTTEQNRTNAKFRTEILDARTSSLPQAPNVR